MRHRFAQFAAALLVASLSAHADNLSDVLGRMDRAAASFKGMTADLKQTSYTAVIKDTEIETGRISLIKPKPKEVMMRVEFNEPRQRSVSFKGKKLEIYYPKLKTVQVYDLGKQGALVEQFLLLGFGASGSELARSYEVKFGGPDTIGGAKAQRLELTPKSQEALNHVRKIDLWIAEDNGQPVQQKIYQPSNDYKLINYSNVVINPALKASDMDLVLPKDVKKEYPQK